MNSHSSTRLAHWLLALLALTHIVLAVIYASVTPYRTAGYLAIFRSSPYGPNEKGEMELKWPLVPDIGAPDERAHANYIITLLEGNGIPAYQINIPDPNRPGHTIRNPNLGERYEDHQPPLYYLAAAGFGKLIGIDPAKAADPNAGLPLRYVNALFGAATVVGVFFLAFWGLRRRDVAILAAAITALLPMHLALSGAIGNDPLTFAICTWTLAVFVLCVNDRWTLGRSIVIGLLIGLGLLTKSTALALFPIALTAFILSRSRVFHFAVTMLLPLVVALPLFLRNMRLYGDPLGLRSFKELFADALPTNDFIAGISGDALTHWIHYVGWWTARSFFGVFGYMDIFLNERGMSYTGPANNFGPNSPNTLYRVLLALAAIAVLGFFLAAFDKKSRADAKTHILNGVFLAVITVLFILYNVAYFQGQARYFYPAIGPIAIGFALGAIYLAKSKKIWVIGSIVALLLALNAYALSRLPGEFAKRVNPNLANQTGMLTHPISMGSEVAMRPVQVARRLE